jgi:hypothetical protein
MAEEGRPRWKLLPTPSFSPVHAAMCTAVGLLVLCLLPGTDVRPRAQTDLAARQVGECPADLRGYRDVRWPNWDPTGGQTEGDWRSSYFWRHQHPADCTASLFALKQPSQEVGSTAMHAALTIREPAP